MTVTTETWRTAEHAQRKQIRLLPISKSGRVVIDSHNNWRYTCGAAQDPKLTRTMFSLSKWYLDCVSEDGDVFIGYLAELRWRALAISYASRLERFRGEEVRVKTSLRKSGLPRVDNSSVRWDSSFLDVAGEWKGTFPSAGKSLLKTDAGELEWHCLQPGSSVEINSGSRQIKGHGYVDHVTVTLPPWQLPLDELRWGRFVTNDNSVVWLNWQGKHQINLALHNGSEIEDVSITDELVSAKDLTLNLHPDMVLREGPLVKTALATIPGIQNLFPGSILQTHECKWLSRATVKLPAAGSQDGWAIHEIVRFGNPSG